MLFFKSSLSINGREHIFFLKMVCKLYWEHGMQIADLNS